MATSLLQSTTKPGVTCKESRKSTVSSNWTGAHDFEGKTLGIFEKPSGVSKRPQFELTKRSKQCIYSSTSSYFHPYIIAVCFSRCEVEYAQKKSVHGDAFGQKARRRIPVHSYR